MTSGSASDGKMSAGQPVDLGLSVRWSSVNVGASTPEEYGDLVGWGDVTGQNRSENSDEYPFAEPPAEISGTTYDITRSRWGAGWRLPTAKEFQELIGGTTWRQTTRDGGWGYEFVGTTGNSIFLPAVGGRVGDRLLYQTNGANYWSGALGSTPNSARYLFFYSPLKEDPQMGELPRHYGFAVRPVTE